MSIDIKTEILIYLSRIKNKYNASEVEHKIKNIDHIVTTLSTHISEFESGKLDLRFMLDEFFDTLLITEVFNDGNVSLFASRWLWKIQQYHDDEKYYSDILKLPVSRISETEAIELTKRVVCIFKQPYTEIKELDIPTGEIVFANFFINNEGEYAFDMHKDLKYDDDYSINTKYGRQNCMNWLAKHHNLGYTQLGNTSCSVYKVNNDKIYITSTWCEDTNGNDVLPPDEWEYLGRICCDVWRIEFIDKMYLDANKNVNCTRLKENDHVVVKVAAGKWSVHNYYRDISNKKLTSMFGYPVWVELNRIE